jgi:hypothetical protein
MTIETPEGLKRAPVKLVGEDGNAWAIMGRVTDALRRAGNEKAIIEKYREQAMSGDYDNLLAVTLAYVEDVGEEAECINCGDAATEENGTYCYDCWWGEDE